MRLANAYVLYSMLDFSVLVAGVGMGVAIVACCKSVVVSLCK